MTLEEYIKNPMGSSVMTNRQVYYNMYSEKWNTIRLRENGLILYTLYKGNEEYFIHFKIPSEVVPKFYYDTILRFYPPKNGKEEAIKSRTLNNYDVQFYSNDPSFCFTFAHAFNKNGLFIKDLESKMIEKCLKQKAVEKNPKDEVGYVKSLYFAYLETKEKGLMLKSKWEVMAKPYSKKVWNIVVEHAYDVVERRQKLGQEIAEKERKEKKKSENKAKSTGSSSKTYENSFKSPNQSNIGHFKRTNFNKIAKIGNIKKGIGHISNPFKSKKK